MIAHLDGVKMQRRQVGNDRGQEAGEAHRKTPLDDGKMELLLLLFYHFTGSSAPPQLDQILISYNAYYIQYTPDVPIVISM